MVNAVNDILFLHRLHGFLHQSLMALLCLSCELQSAEPLEFALQHGERELDRVPLRRIAHVVNPPESELPHLLLRVCGGVDVQLIHEEGDLIFAIPFSKPFEPILELRNVYGLGIDLVVLLSLFLRDGGEQCQSRLIQKRFIDPNVLPRQGPLCVRDCLPCEHCFVKVDDPVSIILRHR